jgi:hypothetical protein
MDELVKLFLTCGVQSVDLLERSKLAMEQEQASALPGSNRSRSATEAWWGTQIFEKRADLGDSDLGSRDRCSF